MTTTAQKDYNQGLWRRFSGLVLAYSIVGGCFVYIIAVALLPWLILYWLLF